MSPTLKAAIDIAALNLACAYRNEVREAEKTGQPVDVYGVELKGGDFARLMIDLAPLAFALAKAMQAGDAVTVMGGGKELTISCK